jgi:polyisoprenyl-phosphate glycosyltransferase
MNSDTLAVKTIDMVVAIRNEESNIGPLAEEIRKLNKPGVRVHMIFVEDGSTDATVSILHNLAKEAGDITFYSLENPFGQGLALAYGLLQSKGDAAVTLDADGSHPLEIAGEMIRKFLDGADIVQGNRIAYDRKSIYRKVGSKIYFVLFTLITGVNLYKQNVHFRLMSRRATSVFKQNKRWWYSLRTKFRKDQNFILENIDFIAPERVSGTSKFNFKKLLNFAYVSFLTLTGIPAFILLNLLGSGLVYLLWQVILPVSLVTAGLLLLNIAAYLRKNSIDYLKKIALVMKNGVDKTNPEKEMKTNPFLQDER